MGTLKEEAGKLRYYIIALAWLMLMMIFTYTAILSESMMVGNTLECAYWSNQCTMIAFIVNCGLIFMVVFDFMAAGKSISYTMMLLVFLGIILAFGIYGHTRILKEDKLLLYKYPLNWPPLSQVFHLAFLLILLWLKERSIEISMIEEKPAKDI